MSDKLLSIHRIGTPHYGAFDGLTELGKVTEHRSTGTEYYYYYCKPEKLEEARVEFAKVQARAEKINESFMKS